MPRGGRRQGTPGRAYPQRTDLNADRRSLPVQAPRGLGYGERKQLEDAQRAIPLASPPSAQRTSASPSAAGPMPLPSLTAPTSRPTEPLTAGADFGPGPGSEIMPQPADSTLARLRALYKRFPTEDLRELIEEAEEELGQ